MQGTDTINLRSEPGIESLRPYLDTNTVGWDLAVPDVFRAAQFIKELKRFEQTGDFPNLVIICLPNDHTSGTGAGSPTPAAQVADNDLAFGQIVEAISARAGFGKTPAFWRLRMIRRPAGTMSAAIARPPTSSAPTPSAAVVSTQYNQTSLLRKRS